MAGDIINYDDQRLTAVEKEGAQRKQEVSANYDQMIKDRDIYTQQQQQNVNNWAQQQTELQQAKTDQAINRINQSKEQGEKDYQREQKGAYTDYMKQSNQYGANAEMMARQGLNNSGYSESSQVSMWNAYQQRYASARESYNKAVLEWDNMMKDAELSNNEALANIAQQKLDKSLEIALQGFEYKNNLILQRDNKIDDLTAQYNQQYQNVLAQINREYEYAQQLKQEEENKRRWEAEQEQRRLAEEEDKRRWELENKQQQEQFQKELELKLKNFDLAEKQRQDSLNQWQAEHNLKKQQQAAAIASSRSGGSSGGYYLSNSGSIPANTTPQNNTLSSAAQQLASAYKIANGSALGKTVNFESMVTKARQQGKINDNDVRLLVEMYG